MRRFTKTRRCSLLLVLAIAGGCSSSSTKPMKMPAADMTPGFRSAILFSDSEANLENGVFATKFRFAYLRDLWVRVTVEGMPRVSVLSLEFINPIGEHFYINSMRFSPDSTMNEMMMPNLGHALPVLQAKPITGGFALDHSIAIGGSTFERYPNPDGTWEVRASVEGVPGMLAAPLEVTMGR